MTRKLNVKLFKQKDVTLLIAVNDTRNVLYFIKLFITIKSVKRAMKVHIILENTNYFLFLKKS